MLKKEHARARLLFARRHRHWRWFHWAKVDWSDECSVERGKGKKVTYTFRRPGISKWDGDKIQTYPKGKDISVMVWAAFNGF